MFLPTKWRPEVADRLSKSVPKWKRREIVEYDPNWRYWDRKGAYTMTHAVCNISTLEKKLCSIVRGGMPGARA